MAKEAQGTSYEDQLAPLDVRVLRPPALSEDKRERVTDAEGEDGNQESENSSADVRGDASVECELSRLRATGRRRKGTLLGL